MAEPDHPSRPTSACCQAGPAGWEASPGRHAELAGVADTLAERRAATDRYLRAFEAGRLSKATCAYRVAELEREVQARQAVPEAECEQAPTVPHHPGWYHNLRAAGRAEIQVGAEHLAVSARTADPTERSQLFPALCRCTRATPATSRRPAVRSRWCC